MMRAVHPGPHHILDGLRALGNVLARPEEVVALTLDPLARGRAVAPLVRHLGVLGHVTSLHPRGLLELRVDGQRGQLPRGSLPVVRLDQLGEGRVGRLPCRDPTS